MNSDDQLEDLVSKNKKALEELKKKVAELPEWRREIFFSLVEEHQRNGVFHYLSRETFEKPKLTLIKGGK